MTTTEKRIEQAVLWVRTNQEKFWAITGTLLLSLLFIGLAFHHHQTENDDAWSQLGAIQGQLMQGKMDETRKGLDAWQMRFQGTTAATYAKFMRADLLYRTTDYTQAAQVYGDIVKTGRPDIMKPLALSAQISSEEMAGHYSEAQTLAQTFLDRYPDHFMAASMYMTQARLAELIGNPAAAVTIYERFILLFPQSPWTALAKARSQALGSQTKMPVSPPTP